MPKFNTPIQLKDDEELVLEVRHYFLMFLPHLIISVLIIIIDFFLLFFLFNRGTWGVWVFLLILLISILYIFKIVFFWKKNYFVISSQRIIDYDQQGFFNKKVSEIPFEKVRDMSFNSKGLWQTLYKYGNIRIKLMGSERPLVLYNIKDPEDIHKLLSELVRKYKPKTEIEEGKEDLETAQEVLNLLKKIKTLSTDEQEKIYFALKQSLNKNNKDKLVIKENGKKVNDKILEDYWKEQSI